MMLQKEGIDSADEMQSYFGLLENAKERHLKKQTDPLPPPAKLICQHICMMFCENYMWPVLPSTHQCAFLTALRAQLPHFWVIR